LSSEVLTPQDTTTSEKANTHTDDLEDWSEPVNISRTQDRCKDPKVTVDELGIVHAVWAQKSHKRYDIFYSKTNSDEKWQSPENLSGGEAIKTGDGPWLEIQTDINRIPNVVYIAKMDADYEIIMQRFLSNEWTFFNFSKSPTTGSTYPSLVIDPNKNDYYVFWSDEIGGGYSTFTRYLLGGIGEDWLSGGVLPTHKNHSYAPQADIDTNGKIYLVYNRRIPGCRVFFTESEDATKWRTWMTPPFEVSSGDIGLYYAFPEIAVDWDGNVYIVWMQKKGEKIDVFFRKKTNAGWQGDGENLSNSSANSENPVIGLDKATGYVYVAWEEGKEIKLIDSENGINWSAKKTMTKNHYHFEKDLNQPIQQDLDLAVSNLGFVHLVFSDYRSGKSNIYHMFKTGREDVRPEAPISVSLNTLLDRNNNKKTNIFRWKANDENKRRLLDKYHVYRKEVGQNDNEYIWQDSVELNKHSYEDIGCNIYKKWEYAVKVKNLKGSYSNFSDSLAEKAVFTPLELDVESTQNRALFSAEKIITLTWKDTPLNQAVQDREFNIYRKKSTDAEFPSMPIAEVDINSCISDTNNPDIKIGTYEEGGLNALDSYVYRITVEDSKGNESDPISKGEN
jgi:hypothetical protein